MLPHVGTGTIPRQPISSRTLGDSMRPSFRPPKGLLPDQVPQFVVLGCDDNPDVEPMQWLVDFLSSRRNPTGGGSAATFDGTPARVSFYTCGKFLDENPALQALHREAFEQGHEIGNHTQNHHHGGGFSVEQWLQEISAGQLALVRAGIPEEAIYGFRTPYLENSANTYAALTRLKFSYDASIEEGLQPSSGGDAFLWPYTLDQGSPAHDFVAAYGRVKPLGRHPGLWQVPNHVIIIPSDDVCERYDCRPGLRDRVQAAIRRNDGWNWNKVTGKLTAFDYNMWTVAELKPNEVLGTLKHMLDLRLATNRAPFLFGAHTDCNPATEPGKRRALEAFIDYALSKDAVRLVPAFRVVEWMRDPQALKGAAADPVRLATASD
jgi:peptidoglycan/xylan/chitin deacetylase (PgdA/CDA1 family)